MNGRLLPLALIPTELFDGQIARLPGDLVNVYVEHLHREESYETAVAGTHKKDIHGGPSRSETIEHFAHRFPASAGRIEIAALDPSDSLSEVPNAILSTFAEGHVAVLDIPCGPFSSTLSLLCTLSVLRNAGVLPKLPLTVSLFGGDCSSTALTLGKRMLRDLYRTFRSVGITLRIKSQVWDAIDAESTARLLDQWFVHAGDANEFVVCITNFSGALIKGRLLQQFEPNLHQVLARLYGKKYTLLWIEPNTTDAQNKLLPRVLNFLRSSFPRLTGLGHGKPNLSTTYLLKHPLIELNMRSGIVVERFQRS